jgi:acyl-CoA thioester hydrolase
MLELNGKPLSLIATVQIDIPFHDVDAMEVVWHGNYTRYFEIARCALLDAIAYDYPQMRTSGFAWPIIDLRVKFIRPCHFKQRIVVSASLVEFENRLKINYLIVDAESGARLSKAYTTQVAVDMSSGAMCFSSPPVLLQRLSDFQAQQV